jgi:predicted AAA+ superfamily ATPase
MLVPRAAEKTVIELARGYPIVAVTGPRQSGKTTLARKAFADKPYISLEDMDVREFVAADPRGFLAQFPDGAVIDEAQRGPALFSYLQTRIDEEQRPGQFILTGSQQFNLMAGITQSLAGRVALVSLLPFTLSELHSVELGPKTLEHLLFSGLYPPIYDRGLDPGIWHGNYVSTYVERDVRQMINVRDLSTFQRFVRMCAARSGQLLNLSMLANDCGVTHSTARAWLSVLEAGYIVHLLRPHHRNFNKRLVKTSKLYFYDSGLAAWLLGIQNSRQLATHAQRGALFETWVVGEFLKNRYNSGRASNLFFWRDKTGNEVDVLIEQGEALIPVELKSGQTITGDSFAGLGNWQQLAGRSAARPTLVYGGKGRQTRSDVNVVPWQDFVDPLVVERLSTGAP